jgi:hypothetical protein
LDPTTYIREYKTTPSPSTVEDEDITSFRNVEKLLHTVTEDLNPPFLNFIDNNNKNFVSKDSLASPPSRSQALRCPIQSETIIKQAVRRESLILQLIHDNLVTPVYIYTITKWLLRYYEVFGSLVTFSTAHIFYV